ncbi:hypothetical protein CORC01_12753 [Colletotrichum orchidophilum]|uniref:Uncharacterized protein n=1 Tax=Colletotrichum orchidophilum TaxID=1209926 RepID=A0A1G4AS69_9PEZI|nr:uncharacterized protein CORC01_12753 [Colletotrichum orchidophilum]OHE91965.1 hypothetical protein CORC01_12753 [Colletotrichum orchidophilum]
MRVFITAGNFIVMDQGREPSPWNDERAFGLPSFMPSADMKSLFPSHIFRSDVFRIGVPRVADSTTVDDALTGLCPAWNSGSKRGCRASARQKPR